MHIGLKKKVLVSHLSILRAHKLNTVMPTDVFWMKGTSLHISTPKGQFPPAWSCWKANDQKLKGETLHIHKPVTGEMKMFHGLKEQRGEGGVGSGRWSGGTESITRIYMCNQDFCLTENTYKLFKQNILVKAGLWQSVTCGKLANQTVQVTEHLCGYFIQIGWNGWCTWSSTMHTGHQQTWPVPKRLN